MSEEEANVPSTSHAASTSHAGGGGVAGGLGGSQVVTDVGGLPCFNSKDDPTTLGSRWKRWKCAFQLYLTSKGVTADGQKLALLLHMAGIDFQDVYYTLVSEAEEKTFQQSIQNLDNYFTPKANVSFERHVFRQMEQGPSETVDQFVCRLRQKATLCDFSDVDEAIQGVGIPSCGENFLRKQEQCH